MSGGKGDGDGEFYFSGGKRPDKAVLKEVKTKFPSQTEILIFSRSNFITFLKINQSMNYICIYFFVCFGELVVTT